MKLVEVIERSRKSFARTSDGTGYDIILNGVIDLSYNAFDDTIRVLYDNEKIDMIDISEATKENGVYRKEYVEYDAAIIITRNQGI